MDLKRDYDYYGDNCVKSCLRAISKSLGPKKSQKDCLSQGRVRRVTFQSLRQGKCQSFSPSLN